MKKKEELNTKPVELNEKDIEQVSGGAVPDIDIMLDTLEIDTSEPAYDKIIKRPAL